VVSFTLRPLYPQGNNSCYPFVRSLDGPQNRSELGGEEKNSQPLPGLETSIIQPVAQRHTTELSRLLIRVMTMMMMMMMIIIIIIIIITAYKKEQQRNRPKGHLALPQNQTFLFIYSCSPPPPPPPHYSHCKVSPYQHHTFSATRDMTVGQMAVNS
jgi:hypothetical protein